MTPLSRNVASFQRASRYTKYNVAPNKMCLPYCNHIQNNSLNRKSTSMQSQRNQVWNLHCMSIFMNAIIFLFIDYAHPLVFIFIDKEYCQLSSMYEHPWRIITQSQTVRWLRRIAAQISGAWTGWAAVCSTFGSGLDPNDCTYVTRTRTRTTPLPSSIVFQCVMSCGMNCLR